jgi:hypothetical protein
MAPPAQKFGGNASLRAVLCEATPSVIGDYGSGEGEDYGAENERESYPHSTQWTRNYLKRRIRNSTGSAMAYVRFVQILYSTNGTSGPSDPK